jgi:hypothetical protein
MRKLNRRIKKLSENLGFVSHLDTDVERTIEDSDEILAARSQRDYEEEDARWERETAAWPTSPSAWEGLVGVPMSRVESARSTGQGYQYNPYIPQSVPSRHSATARQLTFGDEEVLVSDPIRRGPVSQLLDRSTIFDTEPNPPPHSFASGGIRLSGRNRSSTTPTPAVNGPIKPPTLYPIPQINNELQMTVTPPTPVLEPRPHPTGYRIAPRSRLSSSSLADPLEMSALAGALGDRNTGLGIQVELELEDDLEMEEAIEDTGSDSESSDETIRQHSPSNEATSTTRTINLSEAFETPIGGRGKAKRPLEEKGAEDEEELMDYAPPTFREEPVRPQRPARVLFGSPGSEGQGKP